VSIGFLVTSLVVVASPGTGVLFTVAAGLSRGRRASSSVAFQTLRTEEEAGSRSPAEVIVSAVLVNVLNPKLSITGCLPPRCGST
jgi:threonine/homoserine/homoserine lactone efflux protein